MALPHLLKYVYSHSNDEIIRRGKKIQSAGQVELIDHNQLTSSVSFRVKDDVYNTWYKVHIHRFREPKSMILRCGCPYNAAELCRHKAAALLALQEMADRNQLNEGQELYRQQHTTIKLKALELRAIKQFCSAEAYTEAEAFLREQPVTILKAADETVLAEMEHQGRQCRILIKKNEERNLDTSCDCDSEQYHPLCVHKTALLLQLMNAHGPNYFDTIRNWDRDKNKLLAMYGYSLDDDLSGKFTFTYQNGRPFLRVLDTSIKRVQALPSEQRENEKTGPKVFESRNPDADAAPANDVKPFSTDMLAEPQVPFTPKPAPAQEVMRLGAVFSHNIHQYPNLQIDVIQGRVNEEQTEFSGNIYRLDLSRYINLDVLDNEDRQLVQQVRKLLPGELSRYLNRNSPFSGIWDNIVQPHDDELPADTRQLIIEYLHPKIQRLFTELSLSNFVFFLARDKSFTPAQLEHRFCSHQFIRPAFTVTRLKGGDYLLKAFAALPGGEVALAENTLPSSLVFQKDDVLYLWDEPEDVILLEQLVPGGEKQVPAADWPAFLSQQIVPLTRTHTVRFAGIKMNDVLNDQPKPIIQMREKGEYLIFQPIFNYGNHPVYLNDPEKLYLPGAQGELLIIHRKAEAEQAFLKKIQALHSAFIYTDEAGSFALKGTEVLKNNWFFLFTDALKEMDVPLVGLDSLKAFRFNTSRPSTRIYISSNTDWFDARVDIQFGEQKVTVAEIKKALAAKQSFVQLSDGTLGILPEDWIKKYSLLFRVGDGKEEKLKLSKYHYSIIDELYQQRNEEELVFQLEEKFERLRDARSIDEVPAPAHLQDVLRPYQVSGFQWLNYLNTVQWGGILADDMGLGKTIQALTFMQHLRTHKGSLRALVVCPTTLMYNWENEISKFTPALGYYIHHGGSREAAALHNPAHELIITTYGTLRSDVKHFVAVPFDYVVLDESQAIKNPSSKVTKAASLLQAKARLCLSGTPLQNNTFDIYAQMNFLNPGMLGSLEFFRQEFAVPIDKFGEKEQKEHLRKLLYPFLLRRTKEQVAKDLPAKTETVLFCEMGKEQRDIYNAFRNDFRDRILGVVDSEGIGKSQLTILQGLMKLRQICDSPAIMNEPEKYPNVSVKLEEIGREITENISNHKALVFSQFLGMLGLIRQRLEELGVPYEYFDGSTSPTERERAIQRFQNDDECRVFLISLKAGGVGLNLTAADYVYLVDPWWNPAVESQAIDRTHRIGQTKNIFAYRMICKDTVEDKIRMLQEKKRMLAADLITDDSGFVKSLSRSDIEYLFS